MHQFLRIDLPYAEYWIPLLIGMTVGVGAIVLGKVGFGRRTTAVRPADNPESAPAEGLLVSSSLRTEQRQVLRREGNPTDVYVAAPGQKDRPLRGWIVDRSLGGLCLNVNDEIKPGAVLSILPMNAPEMTHWVDIEVKSCRRAGKSWEIGCQFVKTPPFSILMMFG